MSARSLIFRRFGQLSFYALVYAALLNACSQDNPITLPAEQQTAHDTDSEAHEEDQHQEDQHEDEHQHESDEDQEEGHTHED